MAEYAPFSGGTFATMGSVPARRSHKPTHESQVAAASVFESGLKRMAVIGFTPKLNARLRAPECASNSRTMPATPFSRRHDDAAIESPSELQSTAVMPRPSVGYSASCAPVAALQMRIVPSDAPLTTRALSGLNAALQTAAVWPLHSCIICRVCVLQSRTVLSLDVVATSLPFGLNATLVTCC